MSEVASCPCCGGKAKIKEQDGQTIYQAVQDEEAFKKINQLKKDMEMFRLKSEHLENELNSLKGVK